MNQSVLPSPARPRNVTISDVAKLCGLSVTTVSHALGNSPRRSRLSEKTIQRVVQAADGLNYKPSWRARALATKSTQQIGFLYQYDLPELRGIFYDLLGTMNSRLLEAGYHLTFVPMHDKDWIRTAGDPRFDACVLSNANSTSEVDRMTLANAPCVLVNSIDDPRHSSVHFDDRGGMALAVAHLVELGHRNIAYYFSQHHTTEHVSVTERRQGFLDSMARHGLSDRALVYEGEVAATIARADFTGPNRVTAVVCYSDESVIEVLSMLQRRGLRTPQDVSLIGFNDVYPMPNLHPAITCVRVPGGEMGAIAAQLILEQLNASNSKSDNKTAKRLARRVVVPESLVIRESTAPPSAVAPTTLALTGASHKEDRS